MDWCSPPRLKLLLTMFLHLSTNVVCLHGNPATGVDYNLRCVNDYLVTINCSLSFAPSEDTSDNNSSYSLIFQDTTEPKKFVCMLTNRDGDYFCSIKTSAPVPDEEYYLYTFSDLNSYDISLCHNQNNESETCDFLGEYEPVTNIKPNPPCCLTVSHNSSQYHFTWKSTYEKYAASTDLIAYLQYQLHYYKRGDTHKVKSRIINTDSLNYSVDDLQFEADTVYAARVRSSPNEVHYEGQWSTWSSEVHWKMEAVLIDPPSHTFVSGLGKVFILLCVVVPLALLICYGPVKKWRRGTFIPTPAPYFDTLYNDCQGDFKSWVVTQVKTADMLKAEETLQIDTLIKCVDNQEEECQPQFHHKLIEGSTYSNISDPGCDTSLLGIPYAVSTMAPLSTTGSSLKSLTLSSQPGSPEEGDSGCWLCSHTSLEREPPFYCNEYCTLSAFQQTTLVPAARHGSLSTKSCPMGMMRADVVSEA
ncbi:interleukin-21 receptor [Symphorus nematophorus]